MLLLAASLQGTSSYYSQDVRYGHGQRRQQYMPSLRTNRKYVHPQTPLLGGMTTPTTSSSVHDHPHPFHGYVLWTNTLFRHKPYRQPAWHLPDVPQLTTRRRRLPSSSVADDTTRSTPAPPPPTIHSPSPTATVLPLQSPLPVHGHYFLNPVPPPFGVIVTYDVTPPRRFCCAPPPYLCSPPPQCLIPHKRQLAWSVGGPPLAHQNLLELTSTPLRKKGSESQIAVIGGGNRKAGHLRGTFQDNRSKDSSFTCQITMARREHCSFSGVQRPPNAPAVFYHTLSIFRSPLAF